VEQGCSRCALSAVSASPKYGRLIDNWRGHAPHKETASEDLKKKDANVRDAPFEELQALWPLSPALAVNLRRLRAPEELHQSQGNGTSLVGTPPPLHASATTDTDIRRR